MHIQEYLRSGKTLIDLEKELGIRSTFHPTEPLVIVNYDQIDSPKVNPIVRECRGLVLRSDNFDLVSRSFYRFYNWGEVQEEMKEFDFSKFYVQTKHDGSLVNIFYFDNKWYANTRGSFGLDNMQFQTFNWHTGFCHAMNISDLQELDNYLDRNVTYTCEFCSLYNKIVRKYLEPTMYLLTAFVGAEEVHIDKIDKWTRNLFKLPERYDFKNIQEIQDFLNEQSTNDPTFEGVVIRDHKNLRYKIKNLTYLSLHRLRGEGDNLYNPKNLLPFILAGETDELITYFSEVKPALDFYNNQFEQMKTELFDIWNESKDIVDQKTFALAVKDHSLSSVLFNARKLKKSPEYMLRNSPDLILKKLKLFSPK